MSKEVKTQGEAEKVALAVFAILPLAAIASWFIGMPIWVKFVNIVIAATAFALMFLVNKKSTISEGLMIIVWVVAMALMAWVTFTHA